jgi:hypothetical protein
MGGGAFDDLASQPELYSFSDGEVIGADCRYGSGAMAAHNGVDSASG